MNSCCDKTTDVNFAPMRAECPISKTLSKKIQLRTLKSLLKPDKVVEIKNAQYYFCAKPDCNVVYFSNENIPYFVVSDVSVKIFAKDKGEDVNVCYCFNWSRARIKEELTKTGKSTASIEIAKEVKAGNCACDIKNPNGECCLGDVNLFIKNESKKI